MINEKNEAFERQGISPELRTEEHFFFDSNEAGEYFAVPREFIYQGDTFELIENGGAISEKAVVTNSEIGPRSMIKAGSFIINSTIQNFSVENSVISDSVLENPTDYVESRVGGSSIGIGSHVSASDIFDSDIGSGANIGPRSLIQDSNIGNNFTLQGHSYILGDAPAMQHIRGGMCVIQDDVMIGHDTTIHAGVKLGNEAKVGSGVTIDEYTEIHAKTVIEDLVKIGSCVRIGKESYLLNRVMLNGGKQLADRTFIYHTKQDTDYETMATRHMFRHIIPFEHSLRASYNTQSFDYDTTWLMSDKKRPY